MKYKLNENELKIVNRANNMIDEEPIKNNKIECFYMVNLIERLLDTIDYLNHKYDELEQDLSDNYIPRPMSDYYD